MDPKETIKLINDHIDEMELDWTLHSRVQPSRLEWLFASYRSSLNLIDKAGNYITALEKGNSRRDLDLLLKDDEIHQLKQEIERLKEK